MIERVVAYEPRVGQELEVEDERLRGRRRVSFAPADDGVTVALSLEYELKQRHALTWAVDVVRPPGHGRVAAPDGRAVRA